MTRAEIDRSIMTEVWQAASLEHAAKDARAKSGDLYADGKDEAASLWREVGKWLDEKAAAHRRRQKELLILVPSDC